MRVAIVHYWFVTYRGGERVVDALCELFPEADIFAILADYDVLSTEVRKHRLTTSFVQKLPGSLSWHRHLLPLYPLALEQFDLRGYDLVVSSESGPAKGVLTDPETCHICYCHTPMRYIWDFHADYKERSGLGFARRLIFSLTAHYVRVWDVSTAARVDYFVANSENVARRIRRVYRREADVIYPPVDVASIPFAENYEDYYLVVSQLVGYKRIDLAIEACNKLGRKLRIVGAGEDFRRLKRLAGPTVSFLGPMSDEDVRAQYAGCRALLFPGEEDFGIVPVEAQASGKPVIALERGGARETVIGVDTRKGILPECATGIFFTDQTVASLSEAILSFEALQDRFSPRFIHSHAEQFDKQRFTENMESFVFQKLEEHRSISPSMGPVTLDQPKL